MKAFMVFSALVAVAVAQFDISQNRQNGGASPVYGVPEKEPQQPQQPEYTPQIFRHVYVHAAPDEPADEQARVIRVPGGDKHVNIIFVKTPSQSSSQQTEVILPPADENKNLVYVLLKKNEAENNIKIRKASAVPQTKPEVYFIRYKGQDEQQNGGGYPQGPSQNQQNGGGYSQGPPRNQQNGGYTQRAPQPQIPQISQNPAPTPIRNSNGNGNGNGGGYSQAGVYTPSIAPGPIRSPNDVPSSGYGAPL